MRPNWSEFRFLLLCDRVTPVGDRFDVQGGINTLAVPTFPTAVRLIVAVGAIFTPDTWGKRLDLMTWKLGAAGTNARQKMEGQPGFPIFCPRVTGASVHTQAIQMTFFEPGFYGFELFDREGAFAEEAALIATYMLPVLAADSADVN